MYKVPQPRLHSFICSLIHLICMAAHLKQVSLGSKQSQNELKTNLQQQNYVCVYVRQEIL